MPYLISENEVMVAVAKTKTFTQKLIPWRIWTQLSFLLVWLDPFSLRMHGICAPVFHCYGCPLATFACPIGIVATSIAFGIVPFLAIGIIVLAGALLGGIICGWICPFGFLQDLVAKIPTPKYKLPSWAGYFRYAVLIGLVLLIPYFFNEEHFLFICQVCPAGALESRIPRMVKASYSGNEIPWPNLIKSAVTILFVAGMFFIHRPWCRILCPLGAVFGLFNRFSAVYLKFKPSECNTCRVCHKYCGFEVQPDHKPDSDNCVRCLDCTQCPTNALTLGTVFDRHSSKPGT